MTMVMMMSVKWCFVSSQGAVLKSRAEENLNSGQKMVELNFQFSEMRCTRCTDVPMSAEVQDEMENSMKITNSVQAQEGQSMRSLVHLFTIDRKGKE